MDMNELFAANEALVFDYLSRKNLKHVDDYEDIKQHLRIGLWKALLHHNPERGALSTIAFRCMANEYKQYYRVKNKMCRQLECGSVNELIVTEEGEIEYVQTVSSPYNLEDEVVLKEALSRLNEKECKLLILFQNKKQMDIAKEMGHRQKHISALKYRLIKKITG